MRSIWPDYLGILSDPAHVMAEATFILIEALILTPVVRYLIRRHDRKVHS